MNAVVPINVPVKGLFFPVVPVNGAVRVISMAAAGEYQVMSPA